MALAQRHPDARKEPWHDSAVVAWKHRAQENAAGVRIQPVVERLDVAPVREVLFVGQLQFDWNQAGIVGLQLFGSRQGVKPQERILIHVRIHVDGIHGDDRRQQRGRAGDAADVIAFGQKRAADPPIDRGADLRVFQIELRGVAGGLRREQGSFGLLETRDTSVGLFSRDGSVCQQLRGAAGLPPGVLQLHLGPLQFGLPPVEFRLVPARIDDEKHFTLFHELPRLETHLLNVAGDTGPHLDRLHRLGSAGEFIPFDNLPLFDRRHRHRGRRRMLLGGASTAAAEENGPRTECESQSAELEKEFR